ncbi:interleukin-10 receptor subunit beta isoform X2 [Notolabrus celidotus]|uniref:interleukin-10 receptor subunit beta isoform X2 n=1 Tax=Notolabrus celidotus TaxID=1203425 RepID=UPI00148F64EA|nr:interleukin-10 receptor subunit beta isoform X2 [Notolabrus celidotus]
MSVFLWVCLLTWSLSDSAGAELASPQDVSILTLNTNYILTWNWTTNSADAPHVTFTTEHIPAFKLELKKKTEWYTACKDSPYKSCDLTACNLYYKSIHFLRVRASVNGSHSDWVEIEFCPDTDANVGPPSKVDLSPAGSDLDVLITDPLTSKNTSMREHLKELYYNIQYWEQTEDTQVLKPSFLGSPVNLVTLPSLKSWTLYCVRVQTRGDDFYNKSSTFTLPYCMQTQGPLPWWQIFLYFLASLLIFFFLVLICLCCSFYCFRELKSVLYPSNPLPSYFNEYLHDSPSSDVPRLLTPDSESELLCEVTVCPQPVVLEVHQPPLEALLEPDIRHTRQDSSGSTDSGVYSTEGGSSTRHRLPPSCEGSGTSCQDTFDPELVKMRDMTFGIANQAEIPDEGVVDVSV